MTKATTSHSTNTPIDTTRRRFIAVAAAGSVVSVGSLTAAAVSATAPGAPACVVDPIYAAIERHKETAAIWNAAVNAHSNFLDRHMTDEQARQYAILGKALKAARDSLYDTGVDLINTSPTTLGGIARALNYAREQMLTDDGIYMPGDLRLADDTDGEYPVAWIDAFLDAIEHAARTLDWAGKAVA